MRGGGEWGEDSLADLARSDLRLPGPAVRREFVNVNLIAESLHTV